MLLGTLNRNILLVVLTMTSGCVDAISFLALGQVFTAAMTGNTVLFGLALARTHDLVALSYAVALLGFVIGAAIGAMILGRHAKQSGWSTSVTWTIFAELLALLLFAVLTWHTGKILPGAKADILIGILAIGMGLQGVAARRIGVNGVTTTVITSTLTGLVESAIWKAGHAADASKQSSPSTGPKPNNAPLSAMGMWLSVIVAYGVGAALCGAIELRAYMGAIWLPVGFIVFVIASAALANSRAQSAKSEISL